MLSMIPEYMKPRKPSPTTDNEDFTSDCDATTTSHKSHENIKGDDLVLTILSPQSHENNERVKPAVTDVLAEKLISLPREKALKISSLLETSGINAKSLYELSPANIPYRHLFDMTDESPIYHRAPILAPKHNEVVCQKIDIMLNEGILTFSVSQWSFPVVIQGKKDGKPRFGVDYRVLNCLLKSNRFPLPKIPEIFGKLADGVYFSLLRFFSGYWQTRMRED